ncbi:acyl-CoA desaturase [Hymenobacter busanensis]|uniref:Acyl-CoA desaturase n=1 Tax=Hymenobacter busanensis TaxID=2607656 RepID=A0A7L5A3R3_9BACT|nr:acyl-CoA desaturase [Hymenobacter busanensis]KAA9338362.1 acyl-CoA desaturase [Hymenobacter busanensis]QHJ09212.1 acyl-CoA desaturase [Hymenobacter busanensis]
MPILLFFVGHWYLSLFVQTFYLHRYAAHKMYTMNRFWERFFFGLTYAAQGSSYLSPRAYALLHRMHHAFSDTEKDPHSPHYSSNAFSMMWKTKNIYNSVLNNEYDLAKRFEGDYPTWNFLERIGDHWMSRVAWGTAYVLFYVAFATQWWMYLLLPIHFLMGPIHGAIVNWSGHKYGYQNFDNHDKSRNSLFFDFLTGGELFQNNHHKLPMRVNFGVKWWELDPTYPVIWTLDKVGIIKLKKQKSAQEPERMAA